MSEEMPASVRETVISGLVPVPDTEIVKGDSSESLLISVRVALRAPFAAGVKLISNVVPPAAASGVAG